ncbi:MAG: FtsH protease activity modulator HflK [Lachnospiraceae bacterium]|nr:FtsH protease activity modulator HflK [Lachnospiraceae bacterium]
MGLESDFEQAMKDAAEKFNGASGGGFSGKNKKVKKDRNPGDGIKKFGTFVAGFIILIVVANIVFGSFYTIAEEEQAVVCTFGQASAVTDPGLHFKIPFIQTVDKVNTTIQGFAIGYSGEDYASVNYNGSRGAEDGMMITSDYNFIDVDFYLEYRVIDPVKAMYASENPQIILANVAQNCIRTTIGSYGVDAVLTTGKNEIQANIKQMIMAKIENLDIGIQLVNITIQDAEPPTDTVIAAFKSVETAKQGKETALNNANKYRNEQIPNAQAEADRIIQDAEAEKQARINEANGQVARFNSMYEEYTKYPLVTKQRMFYETMEDVLPNLKIVISGGDGADVQKILPLDSFSTNGDSDGAGMTVAPSTNKSSNTKNEEE